MSVMMNIALSRKNAVCGECRDAQSAFVVGEFGVFLCQKCADALVLQVSGITVKNLQKGSFSDKEVAVAEISGNEEFQKCTSDLQPFDFVGKFGSERAEAYRNRLKESIAENVEFHEEQPNFLARSADRFFSWLGSTVSPIAQHLDSKISNSAAASKLGSLIDSSFQVLDAKVNQHMVSEAGVLHPVVSGLEWVSSAFTKAEERDPEVIETETRLKSEEAEIIDT